MLTSCQLGRFAEEHRDYGCNVVTVQACYVAEELFGQSAGGLTHGGKIEALAVLAIHPLVHLERVSGSSDRAKGAHVDHLRRTRTYQPVLSDIRVIAPTGWYGDPSGATEEEARDFSETTASEIATHVSAMLSELRKLNDVLTDEEATQHDSGIPRE